MNAHVRDDRGSHGTPLDQSEEGPIEEKIAKRAYERYIARGGADGRDLDDWLTAERELQDEAEERPD